MTQQTPKGLASSILGWFRDESQDTGIASIEASATRAVARQDDLGRVSAFLDEHDLPVSGGTLAAAWAVVSGSDLALARQIAERKAAGAPVSAHWLACACGERADPGELDEDGGTTQTNAMAMQLKSMIENFSTTAEAARSATGEYGSALEGHADSLAALGSDNLSELTGLVREMIDRTQRAEADMRRSEEEATTLRASLARAQKDAEIDALTGLPNRRAFEGHYREVFADARLNLDTLAVAFCDIDHFKRINDTHGHETGDRMLCTIATALSAISSERCHLSRHGGEEFVMLFRGNTAEEAHARLDALREAFAERKFVNRHSDEPIGQVTFSAGVADVFSYADPREALRAADQALYRAKESGRNRIEIAGPGDI